MKAATTSSKSTGLVSSRFHGKSNRGVEKVSVAQKLEDLAQKNGFKDAIRMQQRKVNLRWTFNELLEAADMTATGYLFQNHKKGNSVLSFLPLDPEGVVSSIATSRAGLVFVPLPQDSTIDDLRSALTSLQPRSLMWSLSLHEKLIEDFKADVPELSNLEDPNRVNHGFSCKKYPSLKYLVHVEMRAATAGFSFEQLRAPKVPSSISPLPAALKQIKAEDPGYVFFDPKSKFGRIHSQSNLVNVGSGLSEVVGLNATHRTCLGTGLVNNLELGVASALWSTVGQGGFLSIPHHYHTTNYQRQAEKIIESIVEDKIDTLICDQQLLGHLVSHPQFAKNSHIKGALQRVIFYGDLTNKEQTFENLAKFGSKLDVFSFKPSTGVVFQEMKQSNVTGNGSVLPGVEVKITNQKGDIVPVGSYGNLKVKGVVTPVASVGTPSGSLIDNEGFVDTGLTVKVNNEGEIVRQN